MIHYSECFNGFTSSAETTSNPSLSEHSAVNKIHYLAAFITHAQHILYRM